MEDNQNETMSEASELPKETVIASSELPKETTTEPKKELSPEEIEKVESRRKVFRSLHEAFSGLDTYEAEGQLLNLSSYAEANWREYQRNVKVGDAMAKIDESELGNKIYEIVKDSTVEEAITYLGVLGTAVKTERFNKTKDMTVKDLEIKLL